MCNLKWREFDFLTSGFPDVPKCLQVNAEAASVNGLRHVPSRISHHPLFRIPWLLPPALVTRFSVQIAAALWVLSGYGFLTMSGTCRNLSSGRDGSLSNFWANQRSRRYYFTAEIILSLSLFWAYQEIGVMASCLGTWRKALQWGNTGKSCSILLLFICVCVHRSRGSEWPTRGLLQDEDAW